MVSKDYLNYADWQNYGTKTREIIKNGSLEHRLVDPHMILNEDYQVTEHSGFT